MFFLIVIGTLAVASAVLAMIDVKTDGYAFHATQRTLHLS